jgi:hypothetical protein
VFTEAPPKPTPALTGGCGVELPDAEAMTALARLKSSGAQTLDVSENPRKSIGSLLQRPVLVLLVGLPCSMT